MSKVTKNGRHSYEELFDLYDKVYIRHNYNKEDGTARTTCLLVNENVVHVGVAKFSNRTFNFSKTKGRNMAQGRAEIAASVFNGEIEVRESKEKRREELSYSVIASQELSVEEIVARFIHNDKEETSR
jgi:hypothetical protein